MGMFVNLLPYRFTLDPTLSFNNLLLQIQQLCLNILDYSYLPYQQIIALHRQEEKLQPNGLLLQPIQTTFQFQSTAYKCRRIHLKDDINLDEFMNDDYFANRKSVSKFDLSLSMNHNINNQTITCSFEYSTDVFNMPTIQILCDRFQVLLAKLFSSSSPFDTERQPVYELSIMLPNEIQFMKELNHDRVDLGQQEEMTLIHHEFVQRAVMNPQKVGVLLDEQTVTYSELLYFVQMLSFSLIDKCNIKQGEIICQCVDRSIEMVIGMLSILTCGCSYCPLSPNDPINRVCSLIDETKTHFVLVHSLTKNKFDKTVFINNYVSFINIEEIMIGDSNCEKQKMFDNELSLLSNVQATIIAYVIFTSGSTGKPKAVQIRHTNFVSCIQSLAHSNIVNSKDIFVQVTPCTFDMHVGDIFGSIMIGSSLIILRPNGNLDMAYLSHIIQTKQGTVIILLSSLIMLLCEYLQENNEKDCLKTLRVVFTGDESTNSKTVTKFMVNVSQQQCSIYNLYGPAECTLVSTCHRITLEDLNDKTDSIPIGRSLSNYQCYVLDEYLQPVYGNQIGELYIGGSGVFAGYYNRSDLTEQVLIDLPKLTNDKCYKTGDLVKMDSSGELRFVGRVDYQIKLRGQRIETGEI
ncbi:unnamed protein product, partial [Didymodactylos carnosus]